MQKIMILGAGIYQVPLIKRAKEMGLYTVVVSYPGSYPGFALADEIVYADTRDSKKILEEAKRIGINGIATTGTDVAVITLGYVCEELGLTSIPLRAAKILTDKAAMKEAFRGKVSTAGFERCSTVEDAAVAADRLGYPVMVKACDSSGSRGITKVVEESALADACVEALAVTKKNYFLVEKYVPGREIGLDAFVRNGKILLFLPHNKYVCRAGNVTIPAGHSFPCRISSNIYDELQSQLEQVVLATGLDNCAVNSDIILTEDGKVSVLEVGGRAGATGIPELITIFTGTDYYELILRTALGEAVKLPEYAGKPCQSRLIFPEHAGQITRIEKKILAECRENDISVELDVREGDTVSDVKNGTDRIGQMVAAGVSDDEMDCWLSRVKAGIIIE